MTSAVSRRLRLSGNDFPLISPQTLCLRRGFLFSVTSHCPADTPALPPATARGTASPTASETRQPAPLSPQNEIAEGGQRAYLAVGDHNLPRADAGGGFADHHRLFRIRREADRDHDVLRLDAVDLLTQHPPIPSSRIGRHSRWLRA